MSLKHITEEAVKDLIVEQQLELKSTHSKLCLPIIDRLYRKMKIGIEFESIKVVGDLIIDGHHRYLAACLADYSLEISPSHITIAKEVTDWQQVIFVNEDWDTKAKIEMLNEKDAVYSNISLERLKKLLK